MARPTIDPHLSVFSAMNFARVRPEVSRSFTFPFLPLPLPFGGFEPGRTGRAPAGVSLAGTALRAPPRGRRASLLPPDGGGCSVTGFWDLSGISADQSLSSTVRWRGGGLGGPPSP